MHIYTEKMQPATNWTDTHSGEPMQMGFVPEQPLCTHCCGAALTAKDCVVQCYYDGLSIWCADGRGCKDPEVIAAKRRREHRNRSLAQQARRAREKTLNAAVSSGARGL
jgi:hypothetical protein